MKKVIILLMVLIAVSCKKDTLELTGMEGKLVNQKGEVQKSFKIYYSIYEFMPNGLVGGSREIKDPVEVVSDNIGSFKISEMLNSRQSLYLLYPTLSNNSLADTFYVKSTEYINAKEILTGKYYKDVILVIKK